MAAGYIVLGLGAIASMAMLIWPLAASRPQPVRIARDRPSRRH